MLSSHVAPRSSPLHRALAAPVFAALLPWRRFVRRWPGFPSCLLALVLPTLAPLPAQGHQLATWFRWTWDTAVAPNGNVYVCGYMTETVGDLPIVPQILGAPRLDGLDTNCFVACLSPGVLPVLQSLVVYGGTDFENAPALDLELDQSGAVTAVHVVGITRSAGFPVTTGAAPTGADAGYWMRFNSTLMLEASTLLGPAYGIEDVACLGGGEALIAGSAIAGTPSTISYGPLGGDNDGLLLHGRLSDLGTGYAYQELRRALVGGSGQDTLERIARTADGSIFVQGRMNSPDYPTMAEFKAPPVESGKGRNVVVPWDYSLQRFTPQFGLGFCSPMGGRDHENKGTTGLVASGTLLAFAGQSTSSDFQPAPQGVGAKTAPQGSDAIILVFDTAQPGAPTVVWSSFFGGDGGEGGRDVHVDAAGRLHVGGSHTAPGQSKGKKSAPAPFPLVDNGSGPIVAQDPLSANGGFYSVFSPVAGGYQLNYSSLTGGRCFGVATTSVALGESVVLTMWPSQEPMPISTTANAPLHTPQSQFDSFILVTGRRAN